VYHGSDRKQVRPDASCTDFFNIVKKKRLEEYFGTLGDGHHVPLGTEKKFSKKTGENWMSTIKRYLI
jgi:hypothetical protein